VPFGRAWDLVFCIRDSPIGASAGAAHCWPPISMRASSPATSVFVGFKHTSTTWFALRSSLSLGGPSAANANRVRTELQGWGGVYLSEVSLSTLESSPPIASQLSYDLCAGIWIYMALDFVILLYLIIGKKKYRKIKLSLGVNFPFVLLYENLYCLHKLQDRTTKRQAMNVVIVLFAWAYQQFSSVFPLTTNQPTILSTTAYEQRNKKNLCYIYVDKCCLLNLSF
jgi:hypothetical protein